jgi:hypothetical protein
MMFQLIIPAENKIGGSYKTFLNQFAFVHLNSPIATGNKINSMSNRKTEPIKGFNPVTNR